MTSTACSSSVSQSAQVPFPRGEKGLESLAPGSTPGPTRPKGGSVRVKRWAPWLTLAVVAALVAALAGTFATGGSAAQQAKKFKIGLVTDIGGLNDRGFNHLAYTGLLQAEKKLKVQGKVLLSNSQADYIPNFTSLVRQKYDLIIGIGFLQETAIDT